MSVAKNATTEHHSGGEHGPIGTVILFLSFAVLAGCLCKLILSQVLKNKFPAPFTVIVLILGFIIGLIISHLPVMSNDFLLGEKALKDINPHLIYYIFLPLLIFDSAFNSRYHVIRQHILSAILLAGPGVLISVGVVATFAVFVFPYRWSWLMSIMFGSILSATDPVAVVALLHESGASKSLAALIDLESLLNDGSAFVIFMVFRDIIVGQSNSAKKIIIDIAKFTVGGPAFGIACGVGAVIFFNHVHNELEVEIISTFGLAYLVFYVADVELGVSAVLALVVMGLFMAKHKYCISSHVQTSMGNTWRIIVDFANILIFIITGIILAHSLIGTKATIVARDIGYSLLLYVVLHLGRILSVLIFYPLMRLSGVRFSWREYLVLVWSGLRGSMSVILALMVDSDDRIDVETRHRYLFHICMMALLTLIINGTSSKFLVRLLGLDRGTPESEQLLLQAIEHMRTQTAIQLHRMRLEKQFADVDWHMLDEYLPEKLVKEMDVERRTSVHRRLSVVPGFDPNLLLISAPEHSLINTARPEIPSISETDNTPDNLTPADTNPTIKDYMVPLASFTGNDKKENTRFRNELTNRFLTALLVDYEKQWYRGMIRRRTLYILIKAVEEAKHKHSLECHWDLILEHFKLSTLLQTLMRFDCFECVQNKLNKLLFDHLFLTIELILAFHSTRTHMDAIQQQFPELANINPDIWNQVWGEIHRYHLRASAILLDLQQSYKLCWRIHMTKRCAQILLKRESKMLTQLYETGMLGHTVYSHIAELVERKSLNLEFYRVSIPKSHLKPIEDAFDLLTMFQALPNEEKARWRAILKSKHQWFQPEKDILWKDQPVSNAYLIARGIVECNSDSISIQYRSGNIVGIDGLFSQDYVPSENYSVSGGLSEGYLLDGQVLSQLLDDDHLAPLAYREIALHVLSNRYQSRVKLNRSQLQLLLHKRAKFYRKIFEPTIHLNENQRLLILPGYLTELSDTVNTKYPSIEFQIFDSDIELFLDSSTIAFSWTDDDEQLCIAEMDQTVHFPLQTKESLNDEVFYPGYGAEMKQVSRRRCSTSLLRNLASSTDV